MNVRSDAAPGTYKYFVAGVVAFDILTDDPHIIIQ